MKKLIGQTMAHWFCVCMTFSRKTASEDRFRQSYLIYLWSISLQYSYLRTTHLISSD